MRAFALALLGTVTATATAEARDADVTIVAGESATIHSRQPATIGLDVGSRCEAGVEIDVEQAGRHTFYVAPAITLRVNGAATYSVRCMGMEPVIASGQLTLTAAAGTAARPPVLSIQKPAEGSAWSSSTAVVGSAAPDSTLAVNGEPITVDSRGRFSAPLTAPRVLSIRIADPVHGVHYFLRRSRAAGQLTQAEIDGVVDVAYANSECRDKPPYDVTIAVRFEIAPTGRADRITTDAPRGSDTDRCYARFISSLRFPTATWRTPARRTFVHPSKPGLALITAEQRRGDIPCRAEPAAKHGMELAAAGEARLAFPMFDAAYSCKPGSRLAELAFMAACNSTSWRDAKRYYGILQLVSGPAAQIARFAQLCERNGIPTAYLDGTTPARGNLAVSSTPSAAIWIDGVDTGLETPIKAADLSLTDGKHKVTFVTAADRFTFAIEIRPAETTTLIKDLR